jgi:uncharacterized protein YukE
LYHKEQTMTNPTLTAISQALEDARQSLNHLRAIADQYIECDTITQATSLATNGHRPYWHAEPTRCSWETRDGTDQLYLSLYWSFHDRPEGLSGRKSKRTYIGNKPHRVQLAEQMIANRRQFLALERHIADLQRTIDRHSYALERILDDLQRATNQAQEIIQ